MFDAASDAGAWLKDLNPEQLRAATASADRPLLILAGAGSGKTTTLSARVAWLIAEGVRLERTDAAPRTAVVAGTFHAIGWRLVRLHAEPLGLPPRLSVIDASDSADLID